MPENCAKIIAQIGTFVLKVVFQILPFEWNKWNESNETEKNDSNDSMNVSVKTVLSWGL